MEQYQSNTTGKAGGLILLAPQRRLQNREPPRGKPSADSTAVPALTSTPQCLDLNSYTMSKKAFRPLHRSNPGESPGRAGGLPL